MNSSNTKILLVAVNSRFNHVSLSVRALEAYTKKYSSFYRDKNSLESKDNNSDNGFTLLTQYFTINQPILDILSQIAVEKPNAVFFSVYIWNAEIIMKVINELKKVLPDCVIGVGGPEVSYDADQVFENSNIDLIMTGEGEKTFTQVCESLCKRNNQPLAEILHDILGLYYKQNDKTIFTGFQPLIKNMDELPFVYDDGNGKLVSGVDADTSIIYYESSRGCPFCCSYCLSSVEKAVRFSSLNRVTQDLDFFMKNKVRLVKFVDRTYNLNEERYIAIWKYIEDHWNGKTTFHFEIAAQQLSQKALDSIKNIPYGCMQFEIGIQSTNPTTLAQVGRPANLEQIHHVLTCIPKTIHVHLDLIAGLPYETLKEFEDSFNYTIEQKPQMLQLGFLKILHGTAMETYALQNKQYKWLSIPPYEVLSSPWVSYDEMRKLKKIDNLVDNYYNSQNFVQVFEYILSLKKNMFQLFIQLASYFDSRNLFDVLHKSGAYYDFFISFLSNTDFFTDEQKIILKELVKFDFIRCSKPGCFPSWYERIYNKDEHRAALEKHYEIQSTRDAYNNSSFESFIINPFTFKRCNDSEKCSILFLYTHSHLKGAAAKTTIHYDDCECFIC